MTTALSDEAISKLIERVTGLPEETQVNNLSKLLVYLIETEPDISQVNQVNVKETEVYLELVNQFTELETKYDTLLAQPPIDIEETEVYLKLLDRFTNLETKYNQSKETIVNIEETKVYLDIQKRFTDLETRYNQLAGKAPIDIKETKVYKDLVNQFTMLETQYHQLLLDTAPKKETTFFWEG